jgi:5-methylcytosine-specific restriction endonuclease McrA
MAYYSLKAQFFVTSDGVAIPKAPPLPASRRRAIFDRDGWKCRECDITVRFHGTTTYFMDDDKPGAVDHILPRSRGGQNTDENLQLLCISCNAQKGAK